MNAINERRGLSSSTHRAPRWAPLGKGKKRKRDEKRGKKVNFCEGLAEIPIFGALTDDFVLLFWGKKAEKWDWKCYNGDKLNVISIYDVVLC